MRSIALRRHFRHLEQPTVDAVLEGLVAILNFNGTRICKLSPQVALINCRCQPWVQGRSMMAATLSGLLLHCHPGNTHKTGTWSQVAARTAWKSCAFWPALQMRLAQLLISCVN